MKFASKNLFMCLHFETISLFSFRFFDLSAAMICDFMVRQRLLTEPPFKQRHANHLTVNKHEAYKDSTKLSKYVWDLKRKSEAMIDWSISDRAHAYDNRTKRCNICLAEKLEIIAAERSKNLTKKSEIVSKCRHRNKFLLPNFTPVT